VKDFRVVFVGGWLVLAWLSFVLGGSFSHRGVLGFLARISIFVKGGFFVDSLFVRRLGD
jgi:hypothetical protein